LSFEIAEDYFEEMSKELLANLGFKVIKENHHLESGKNKIGLCVKFDSKRFLQPRYSPPGLTFVECKSGNVRSEKIIQKLNENISAANKEEEYTKRMGGRINGGILVYGGGRDAINPSVIKLAESKGYYCWDIHRIFFFAMKVFSHSILENWVSESKLGFVINEEEVNPQFDPKHYYVTRLTAVRFSELSSNLEIYFSYFCDCLKGPHEATLGINSLHDDHVRTILDDAYESLKWITKDLYPCNNKHVTIEIHSLSGFTEDAEYKVKLYAPHYKNWEALKVEQLTIDEHTLFKYSVIPWEAVMDYAFTKRTHKHTQSRANIPRKLKSIELDFALEFKKAIKSGEIRDPFTNEFFNQQENKKFLGYETLYNYHVTRVPIKQRLILFSRTSLNDTKVDTIKDLVKELKKDTSYNYTWLGLE